MILPRFFFDMDTEYGDHKFDNKKVALILLASLALVFLIVGCIIGCCTCHKPVKYPKIFTQSPMPPLPRRRNDPMSATKIPSYTPASRMNELALGNIHQTYTNPSFLLPEGGEPLPSYEFITPKHPPPAYIPKG